MLNLLLLLGFSTLILGASYHMPSQRIVGGNETDIEHHKYIVALLLQGGLWCAGTLIHPYWIVTSAQCIKNVEKPRFRVRLGSVDPNDGGEIDFVNKVIEHFSYDLQTLDFDVAILHLSVGPSLVNISWLNMTRETPKPGTMVTVVGWGATEENGNITSHVNEVQIPIVSHTNCEAAYLSTNRSVTNRMICAGILGVGGKGVCQGDLGSPVVANGELVGIVSWGFSCGNPEYPGVFTDIASVRDWIIANSGI